VYQNTPLRDVVADLNRYVDRPISIGQAPVGDLRFTGAIALDTEDRIVKRGKLQDWTGAVLDCSWEAPVLRQDGGGLAGWTA